MKFKIFTSSLTNLAHLERSGIEVYSVDTVVSSSPQSPLYDLMPPWKHFDISAATPQERDAIYLEHLRHVDPKKLLHHISLGGARYRDVALCACDMPDGYSHRHALAKWLGDNLGIEVSDIQPQRGGRQKQRQKEKHAPSLFPPDCNTDLN